ncbi:MAG: DUF1549 domain-containing protein, partial [Verrucomicrobiales bacterium]|nr:DUF1549 domain-containing protein [Verrucomicrobiales bacterium]
MRIFCTAILASAATCLAFSADPVTDITPEQLDFFESKIRPVLAENCYECHSEKEKKRKGGLHLHNRAALRAGGDSGPGLDLLVEAVAYENPDLEMPPDGKLPDHVISDFRAWVKMGAPDPRDGAVVSRRPEIDYEKGRQFWSYRPVADPKPPKNSGRTDVDKFLLAKMEEAGIEGFSPKADKATLLRRVFLDLTGLPPTTEQLDGFLKNDEPTALETVIDELLDSRAFGERWGRHWLDVVRFAESSGG